MKIYRSHISSYQDESFIYQEKAELERLRSIIGEAREGLHYSALPSPPPTTGPIVLLTNTHTNLNALPEQILEQTKLIIHPNSGYDNFSLEQVRKLKAPLIIGNPIRARAVTDYVLSALFGHFTPLKHHERWPSSRHFPRQNLSDTNILLIGHGHIGKQLSQILRPLCAELTIFDPFVPEGKGLIIPEKSQVVILACSLNPTSHQIINQEFLFRLPQDFLLINSARGELIDEKALLEILKERPRAQAILDVFHREPFPENYFQGIPNLIATPHIAGVSSQLNQHIIEFEKQVLGDYLLCENCPEIFTEKYRELILQNKVHPQGFLI